MPSKIGRATEREMSIAVLKIAATKPGRYVTLDELRIEIPNYVELTPGDMEYSLTRPGERLWEQLLRNIQSHHANRTSFIRLGLLDHIPGGAFVLGYLITFPEVLMRRQTRVGNSWRR